MLYSRLSLGFTVHHSFFTVHHIGVIGRISISTLVTTNGTSAIKN